MIRLKLRVSGRVQGVFYRASAKREAERLGLSGFARNEPDGRVTIEVQGDENPVRTFVEWAQHGPERADVHDVETDDRTVIEGQSGFQWE